jgi:hypothetical protein
MNRTTSLSLSCITETGFSMPSISAGPLAFSDLPVSATDFEIRGY